MSEKEELLQMRRVEHQLTVKEKELKIQLLRLKIEALKPSQSSNLQQRTSNEPEFPYASYGNLEFGSGLM